MSLFENIEILRIDGPQELENVGELHVTLFDGRLVKVLVTKRDGGDADLFLDRAQAVRLRDALSRAIERL